MHCNASGDPQHSWIDVVRAPWQHDVVPAEGMKLLISMFAGLPATVKGLILLPGGAWTNLPFCSLAGFHPSSIFPDVLHIVWLGIAADSVGSMLLELVTCTSSFGDGSVQERLQHLQFDLHKWCATHHIDKSALDEVSLARLKVSAPTDYPTWNGPAGRGFACKVLAATCIC